MRKEVNSGGPVRLPESTTAGEKEESLPGREGPLRPDFRGKMRTQGTAGRGIDPHLSLSLQSSYSGCSVLFAVS